MWSDTFLLAERAHFLRVGAWGALCVLAGTAVIAALTVRRGRGSSPLLLHFAAQTAAWGTLELIYVAISLHGLAERDVGSVARLANQIWLYSGLDIGLIGVGAAIAICGWKFARRLGAVGAGIGIVIQGLGLLTLDLYFIIIIARSVGPR
ncbi:MAG: hypothetical protein M3081_00845 [Gemmatimonadota bacterium]|nr:hypothetical protein [Gemmatimonadota bacterium]